MKNRVCKCRDYRFSTLGSRNYRYYINTMLTGYSYLVLRRTSTRLYFDFFYKITNLLITLLYFIHKDQNKYNSFWLVSTYLNLIEWYSSNVIIWFEILTRVSSILLNFVIQQFYNIWVMHLYKQFVERCRRVGAIYANYFTENFALR